MSPVAAAWKERIALLTDKFVPASARMEAESLRRAQLFISFSALGTVFGGLFAAFYLAIGHPWGALIVTLCTLTMVGAPWIVRRVGLEKAGNLYALVLVSGFSALTWIEGGLHGHAIAWVAVLPLCVSLLVNQQAGRWWCAACLAIVSAFCVLEFGHLTPAPYYPSKWETTITAAGYLSLTLFMAAVGLSFERGRRHALAKLQAALSALSSANERLKDLNRERGEFLSIAAHDLRSPLNIILGFAKLAEGCDVGEDEMRRDCLARILSASERMRDLLDSLLSARAIEEGRMDINLQPCNLQAHAGHIVESYQQKARDKNLRMIFERPDNSASTYVQADPRALTQILDNLVSNAIKFSPNDLPIFVRVLEDPVGNTATAEVQDVGPGLSVDDQKKLYGKFARLSARPTGGESSNGLGLSIVKRLAEEMKSSLECRSELGHGATFSLRLPAVAMTSPAVTPMAPAAETRAVPARLRV